MNYYVKTAASVETFLAQLRGRNTKSNKTDVYRSIKRFKGSTKNDLINRLGMPHQTVTSRISVLMDLGVVEVMATRNVISNNVSTFESLFMVQTNPVKIVENQKKRRELRFKRLCNQLEPFADVLPSNILEILNSIEV